MIYEFRGIKPKIHKSCFIVPSADIIGDVEIGEESSVWFNTVIRGDVNTIRIGSRTNIQDGSVLHVTHIKSPLKIGNGVTVGHSVTLHGCTIKDFVLVGMRAVVLDDAEVGDEVFIGAGALVTQGMKIPPRSLVLGSPGKVVRELKQAELDFLQKSAQNYIDYSNWYREGKFPELIKQN